MHECVLLHNCGAARGPLRGAAAATQPDKRTLRFDGGCRPNPGAGGWGAVCEDTVTGNELWRKKAPTSDRSTSNVCEYLGLIGGLREIIRREDPGHVALLVVGDSELVICQMDGSYAVKDRTLAQMRTVAIGLATRFHSVTYKVRCSLSVITPRVPPLV